MLKPITNRDPGDETDVRYVPTWEDRNLPKVKVLCRIEPGCPSCEFLIDTGRTTTLGGCGKHGLEER